MGPELKVVEGEEIMVEIYFMREENFSIKILKIQLPLCISTVLGFCQTN